MHVNVNVNVNVTLPAWGTQGRAHKEIAAKYRVQFVCAAGPCGRTHPPPPMPPAPQGVDTSECTHNGAVPTPANMNLSDSNWVVAPF
jgi:hypothetical protein